MITFSFKAYTCPYLLVRFTTAVQLIELSRSIVLLFSIFISPRSSIGSFLRQEEGSFSHPQRGRGEIMQMRNR